MLSFRTVLPAFCAAPCMKLPVLWSTSFGVEGLAGVEGRALLSGLNILLLRLRFLLELMRENQDTDMETKRGYSEGTWDISNTMKFTNLAGNVLTYRLL